MSQSMSRVALLLGVACLLTQAAPARAQWFPTGNPCCCCCPAPCAQPVSVPCYQTVPVTEYQPVRRTVMKPVVRTEYVDEHVTVLRPVVEQRTAQVPSCTYQPVTEYIPQTRDCGCWHSYCQCTPRCSPCQYDPSPGLMGWMNRTSYSMRMAFTPAVTYRRQWIPNYITTMVPVTRQVAQHSVRSVTYNVTRMEPHRETRKVAVNRVDYETAEVVTQQAVTVMKTIPIGTSVAWVPFGSATATAFAPGGASPDPISNARRRDDKREYEEAKRQFRREKAEEEMRSADPTIDNKRTELIVPQHKSSDAGQPRQLSRRLPGTRTNGWVASKRSQPAGPRLDRGGISVAELSR